RVEAEHAGDIGHSLALGVLPKVGFPRMDDGDQPKARLREVPAASREVMHERAEEFFESRRPLIALARRVDDEIVSDPGDFIALAELAEQLAANLGFAKTLNAAPQV